VHAFLGSGQLLDEIRDPARLMRAEEQVGWLAGALTRAEYRRLLVAAGFSDITVTSTYRAAAGLHSAIIQARKVRVGEHEPEGG
jgi:arsenite methyltransferase